MCVCVVCFPVFVCGMFSCGLYGLSVVCLYFSVLRVWYICVCLGVSLVFLCLCCVSRVCVCMCVCICLYAVLVLCVLVSLSKEWRAPHLIGNERLLEICLTLQCKRIALFCLKMAQRG